jgi:diacylglycerol kinase (ATP)
MWLIANPKAGRGGGTIAAAELERRLAERGIDFTLQLTHGPGHARELAGQAVQAGARVVVVAGGDGTVGEVAEVLKGTGVPLGIVPVGTGNDLARSLGLPMGSPAGALTVIERGETRLVDVGIDRGRGFVSVLGVGFPAAVARRANRLGRLKGAAAFTWAVYVELLRMKPFPLRISFDGGEVFELEVTSVLVQNTASTGGGMKTAPGAEVDDGFLDVVVVTDIGRAPLLWHFPKVYDGRHLNHPCFRAYRCRTVTLDSLRPVERMGDGEDWGWTPVTAHVEHQTLRVFASSGPKPHL